MFPHSALFSPSPLPMPCPGTAVIKPAFLDPNWLSLLHTLGRVVFPNAYLIITCCCVKTFDVFPLPFKKTKAFNMTSWLSSYLTPRSLLLSLSPSHSAFQFHCFLFVPQMICTCSCPRDFAHNIILSRNSLLPTLSLVNSYWCFRSQIRV